MGSYTLRQRLRDYTHYAEVKHLAYNIAALQREKMFHSLALLSFFSEEGKTLSCAALAMAYAETCNTKVLVVDTTTYPNKNSLALSECFNGSTPQVELRSIKELRTRSLPTHTTGPMPVLEPMIVTENLQNISVIRESDSSLLKQVAQDRSNGYGLILLDTTPLHARNKGNVDPLMVARLVDASVLVVSRVFLDAPKLNQSLKLLKDPSLKLIGVISNEARAK